MANLLILFYLCYNISAKLWQQVRSINGIMLQMQKKGSFFSKKMKVGVLVFVALCMIVVIGFLFYTTPEEGGSPKTIGSSANEETPTVTVTNLLEIIEVNRTVRYKGIAITFTQAMIAKKFSDDRKAAGTYTVRVLAKTENEGKQIIGIDYVSAVRLVLPGGQEVKAKLMSIKPAEYPGRPQSGFFDFPVFSRMPLSSLVLRFEDGTTVPLS
jgi:hypothetical protein